MTTVSTAPESALDEQLPSPPPRPATDVLTAIAQRVRRHVADMCAGPEGGHLGGAMSSADILTTLYFSVMRVNPAAPNAPGRDIFLLSKGHAAVALYAVLAERDFLPVAELAQYARPGGRLMGHPVRAVPGVEMPTGSLGHGLALGLGFTLGARLAGSSRRTFVLLGDGELQEGSCWEAASSAAGHRTDGLVAIVDRNGLQLSGRTEAIAPLEPLAERWRSFGWAVREVDGHDHDALTEALTSTPWVPGRPSVLIARTVKGRGVPMMADRTAGHYVTLNERLHRRVVHALESGTGRSAPTDGAHPQPAPAPRTHPGGAGKKTS